MNSYTKSYNFGYLSTNDQLKGNDKWSLLFEGNPSPPWNGMVTLLSTFTICQQTFTVSQQILPNRHNPFHSTFSSGCVCLWLSTLHTRQLPDPCRSCHRMLPEMRWRWFSNAELWCKGRWVNHSAGNPWHIGCIHGLWRRPVMEKNMLSHCLQIF